MRESNYRSVANNRAAVTITTSLYDRRALDVTSDKPLVNSLNHLTYLVSSSAKVRETLSNDGGIERLVEILHECHNPAYGVKDNIFNSERKLLAAWKWTLAFQCLVLIGTRGTEKIRQKVVKAGMLPVIATVLDNYMNLHKNNFHGIFPSATTQGSSQFCPHLHSVSQQEHSVQHSVQQDTAAGQDTTFADVHFNGNQVGSANLGNIQTPNSAFQVNQDLQQDVANPSLSHLNTDSALHSSCDPYDRCIPPSFLNCNRINSLTVEDFESLSIDQLLKLVRGTSSFGQRLNQTHSGQQFTVNNDIRRRYLIICIMKKLREDIESSFYHGCGMEEREYDMDNNLQFLSNLYLQDEKFNNMSNAIQSKIAPRTFTDSGIIIPRDDDVVWCLQLLAYISKYPHLKDVLQSTHLACDMSTREKQFRMISKQKVSPSAKMPTNVSSRETLVPRSRTGRIFTPGVLPEHTSSVTGHNNDFIERFNLSPSNSPQMSDLNIRNDNFDLAEDKLDLYDKPDDQELTEDAEANDLDDDLEDFDDDSDHKNRDEEGDEYLSNYNNDSSDITQDHSYSKLYDAIIDAECIIDELERELTLIRLSDKVNSYIEVEANNLSQAIIKQRLEEKESLEKIWNYDTYDKFDIDDDDLLGDNDRDEFLNEYNKVNLFPVVERFTFLAGTDMYYWSGVIMRNSCRRNDFKGGVRQCGNLECGKWEKYPREFSKCKRCKRTKYCSRDCQMRAWHCHKNWCVPSNSSSNSATTAQSANTAFEGQFDRTMNMSANPTASEAMTLNTAESLQQVSASDQETQFSES